MEDKKEKVYKKIDAGIQLIDNELALHQKNKKAVRDINTLEAIKNELLKMKSAMSPEVFYPTYNYIIRDALLDYVDLSEILLDAYYAYQKL